MSIPTKLNDKVDKQNVLYFFIFFILFVVVNIDFNIRWCKITLHLFYYKALRYKNLNLQIFFFFLWFEKKVWCIIWFMFSIQYEPKTLPSNKTGGNNKSYCPIFLIEEPLLPLVFSLSLSHALLYIHITYLHIHICMYIYI